MTLAHTRLDIRKVGGRIAGDVPTSVDGRRSYVIEGDDAAHYTPEAA